MLLQVITIIIMSLSLWLCDKVRIETLENEWILYSYWHWARL